MSSDRAAWQNGERRLALAAFAAVTALIVVFLLRDASAFVNSAQDELIGHLGASAGFTVAAAGTFLVIRRERPSLLTILLLGAAITIAAELAQGFAPDRGIELRDIATGLGGVLIAAVLIEIVLLFLSLLAALRVHTIAASIASIVLLVMLVFDLAPETLDGASPNGESCPFTTIDGSGQRIDIGASPSIDDGCLVTDGGGLGLFGSNGTDSLGDDSVLLSSPLVLLIDDVIEAGGITISTQFVTGDFSDDIPPPGVIMLLRSTEAEGDLLLIRTREQATQVLGPSLVNPYRALSYPQILEANTRYLLRVELTASDLAVYLDNDLVATNTVDPAWLQVLADSNAADDLTMYIGNSPSLTLPFNGVIEWIEVDT